MLRRYLTAEITAPLVAWTLFLCLMFFVIAFLRGTDVLFGSAITLGDFARISLYLLPQFVVQALPIAFLLALLVGLGRLSEDGELKAMQSLGVSPSSLLAAPVALGVGLSGVLVALSFTLQPWSAQWAAAEANAIIRRNVMEDVRPGVFYEEFFGFTLYTEEVEPGGHWRHVLLFDGRDSATPMVVVAKQGAVRTGAWTDAVSFDLTEGSIHRATRSSDEYAMITFDEASFRAGLGESFRRKNRFSSAREQWTPGELRAAALEAQGTDQAVPLLINFHWRMGQLLMPLSFALLGTPLALTRRGGGRARGFLLTLGGFLAYYLLARAGVQLGEKGQLPPMLAGQVANLTFAAVGLALMSLAARRGAA